MIVSDLFVSLYMIKQVWVLRSIDMICAVFLDF